MKQRLAAIAVLFALGIVAFVVGQEIAGMALTGAAAVLGTVLAFYEVGLSEDRERARSGRAGSPPRT